jgi:hypothetical protein
VPRPRPGARPDPLSPPGRPARKRGAARRLYRAANLACAVLALAGALIVTMAVVPQVLGRSDARQAYVKAVDHDAVVVSAAFPRNHLSVPNRSSLAPIDAETVDVQGYLGIPQDVHRVGVYTGAGRLDGAVGDVVVVGHVNWAGQGAGYLGDIGQLRKGAVVVTRGDGLPRAWRVTGVTMYLKSVGLPQSIFRAAGPRALTLVTCGGVLDEQEHSYLSNVVVTARPVRTIVR